MKKLCFLLVNLLILALFTLSVSAQEPTADEVNDIAEHLNCPTCDTRSLDDCNTPTCIQWKEQIKDLMMQGYTEQEIIDWYVERYGAYVLQEPPMRGLALWAWLLPLVGLVAGTVWLGFTLKKWSAGRAAPEAAETASGRTDDEADAYLRQVEQDLRNL